MITGLWSHRGYFYLYCLFGQLIIIPNLPSHRHWKLIAHINSASVCFPPSFDLSNSVGLDFCPYDDMAEVENASSIDTERLSSFLDIDVPDLQSILNSATENIAFLLHQIQVKATEFEQINNAKDVLEVNYGISCLDDI
jgi:hypothetical protein